MTIFRLLVGVTATAMLVSCSDQKDSAVGEAEVEAQSAVESRSAELAANDGGIPLSTANYAALTQYEKVRDLADRGDFIEANQAARKLTENHPDFVGGWIMVGNTALSGPQFVKATKTATSLSASGTEGERLWAEINMSFVSNDTEQGLKLGKKLVDTYPDAPRAWIVYSGLLAGQNEHAEARAAIDKAVQLAPDAAFPYNNLGFSYLYNDPKDFAKAGENFKRAIEIDPMEDNYWINIGDVHRATGELNVAQSDYSKALEIDATNSVAAVKRAHVNSFIGNYDEARADYDVGIANGQESNQSTLTVYRAFVNLHAGDPRAAVSELKSELDHVDTLDMPDDQKVGSRTFLLVNIADICFNHDMLDDAVGAVEQLSASLTEAGGKSEDADFARQQLATATFWKGKLAAMQGDYDAADARAEEFAALVAEDSNPRKMERFHELLALTALERRDYETAIEHYRQSNLSTSPGAGDVKNIFMLATALKAVGQTDEASELMQQVANWNFNSAWFAMLRKTAAG